MGIVEEIDGRRIAKDWEARARGAANARARPVPSVDLVDWCGREHLAVRRNWRRCTKGYLVGKNRRMWSYALGLAAIFEVISLRRRLDAVTTLLRQGPDPRV